MEQEDRYPSFDFNLSNIREHIKTLPDYESVVEYLDHVEAQFEITHTIFIMNIFREMGLNKYLSLTDGFHEYEPLPESKHREEIIEIAARFAMSELGFHDGNSLDEKEIVEIIKDDITVTDGLPGGWVAYDKEKKAWCFLLTKVAESIRLNLKAERKTVDWLMHRGRLLRREDVVEAVHSSKQGSGGKTDFYKYKLYCPKEKIDTVKDILHELRDEGELNLSDNFDVEDYFSCKRKDEKSGYILEWGGIEFSKKDLEYITAVVEILEERCNVESCPAQVRETFLYPGKTPDEKKINTGSYSSYRRSKITTKNNKGRNHRFKINDYKTDLLNLLSDFI